MKVTCALSVLAFLCVVSHARFVPPIMGHSMSAIPALMSAKPAPKGDAPNPGCCLSAKQFSFNSSITFASTGSNKTSHFTNQFTQIDLTKGLAFVALGNQVVAPGFPSQAVYAWFVKNGSSTTEYFYVGGQTSCFMKSVPNSQVGGLWGDYCYTTAGGWSDFSSIFLGSTLTNVRANANTVPNGGEYIALAYGTCLPMVDTQIVSTAKSASWQQTIFFNQFLEIIAPTAFKHPTNCKAMPQHIAQHEMRQTMLRGRPFALKLM